MLSPLRKGLMTGSRIGKLMKGDPDSLMDLYRELTDDPSYTPPDFKKNWAVQHGIATEELNIQFFEYNTGDVVTRRQEFVIHPKHEWAAVTLDGFVESKPAPLECKAVGDHQDIRQVILPRYAPQAHWQMDCTGTKQCVFSIIIGGREPIWEIVDYDDDYGAELWRRAEHFMQCVWDRIPPVELPPIAAPIKAEKTYEMTGSNAWANEAVTWVTTRQAAKDNEAASKALKGMVPADAIKCFGHGIIIARNRAGSLTIKSTESNF